MKKRVVHKERYPAPGFFTYDTVCNLWGIDEKYRSDSWKKVTCKRCLKARKK